MNRNMSKSLMIRLSAFFATCVVALASCSKEQLEPQLVDEPVDSTEASVVADLPKLSLEAEAETMEVLGDDGRAFSYAFEQNGSKRYPKPVLKVTNGTVPVTMIFRNSKYGADHKKTLVMHANWSCTNGRLHVKGLQLTPPTVVMYREVPTGRMKRIFDPKKRVYVNRPETRTERYTAPAFDFTEHTDGWQVYCIVGGTHSDTGNNHEVSFTNSQVSSVSRGDTRELESIYTSDEWVELDGKVAPTAPNASTTDLFLTPKNKKSIKLRHRGLVLLCSAQNKRSYNVNLRGFRIDCKDMVFSGKFENLTNIPIGQHPSITSDNRLMNLTPANSHETIRTGATSAKHFVCIAYPIDRNLTSATLDISALVGTNRQEEARLFSYNNKRMAVGKFVSIKSVLVQERQQGNILPIETMLSDESTGMAYVPSNSTRFETAMTGATAAAEYEVGELGRHYRIPTVSELAILVPYMREGDKPLGTGAEPILNFADPGDWYTVRSTSGMRKSPESERISVFGQERDYNAEYKVESTVAYAIRFMGHGDKHKAAYRYHKQGSNLVITVRHLGTEFPATLSEVCQESWWNKPPKFRQREVRRIVPGGLYWSSTRIQRAGSNNVVHAMKVLNYGRDGVNKTFHDGAFISDDTRKRWAESFKKKANQEGIGFLLFTSNPEAVERSSRSRN